MSISSTSARNNYTGNGTTATYAYGFRILDDDHISVTVRDSVGTETALVKTTDYTVTGVLLATGGNVVLVDGGQDWIDGSGFLESGWTLSIVRDVPLTQPTDIRNQGSFLPETHEDAFDRIVMQNQGQQDQIDRSVRLPETVDPSTFDPEIPAAVVGEAGAILQVNSTGNGWTVGSSTVVGTTVTPFMETVLDDLDAASARTTLGFAGTGGKVQEANIEALTITDASLASNAVTTAKITDANVTAAKIAEAVRAASVTYGGASAAGTDTYAVTPSPAFTAYATGMQVVFKADVANTAGATLNVNALGAKTLVDRTGTALETGAILAGQMVVAVYDGTNFQVTSALASPTQGVKAWVTFNGTGTPAIGASFNVSSITDHGTGEYTINFTTAFADTNYAVLGMAGNNDSTNQCIVGLWGSGGKAVGSCRIRIYNLASAFDATQIHVAFIGAM